MFAVVGSANCATNLSARSARKLADTSVSANSSGTGGPMLSISTRERIVVCVIMHLHPNECSTLSPPPHRSHLRTHVAHHQLFRFDLRDDRGLRGGGGRPSSRVASGARLRTARWLRCRSPCARPWWRCSDGR